MRINILAFALGVGLLQIQERLPALPLAAGLLLGGALLLLCSAVSRMALGRTADGARLRRCWVAPGRRCSPGSACWISCRRVGGA
jgi:hypothetical protein